GRPREQWPANADIVLALYIAIGRDIVDRAAADGRRDRDARRKLVRQRPRKRGLRLLEIEVSDADFGHALEIEGRLVRRDVDRTCRRVLAAERALRPAQHLDLRDVEEIEGRRG